MSAMSCICDVEIGLEGSDLPWLRGRRWLDEMDVGFKAGIYPDCAPLVAPRHIVSSGGVSMVAA